ncbi:MAG: cytidylate kinase family protein [Clostridia bacterium]|nr:cytidylate kinase family protein [Clostridia bacterium]
MFITIAGALGSGKSTVCRILNEKYGYAVFTTGSILRKLANDKGMTALEFNKYITDRDNNVDSLIDGETKRIAREKAGAKVVFDSRLAWYFVDKSLKVYLTVLPEVAAERVVYGRKLTEEHYSSVEEATLQLQMRQKVENERFQRLYSVDCSDRSNYDLVIDTTDLTPLEVAEKIISNMQKSEL